MGSPMQSFIKSLNEVPEGKFPPQYYTPLFIRSIVFGNYGYPSGLLSHFLFLGDTTDGEPEFATLRTLNNVIGGMSKATYEKSGGTIGESNRLYIFSDGVYNYRRS